MRAQKLPRLNNDPRMDRIIELIERQLEAAGRDLAALAGGAAEPPALELAAAPLRNAAAAGTTSAGSWTVPLELDDDDTQGLLILAGLTVTASAALTFAMQLLFNGANTSLGRGDLSFVGAFSTGGGPSSTFKSHVFGGAGTLVVGGIEIVLPRARSGLTRGVRVDTVTDTSPLRTIAGGDWPSTVPIRSATIAYTATGNPLSAVPTIDLAAYRVVR